jgi:hypothetical protein
VPIIERDGTFMVVLGVGDVGMARVEDTTTKEQYLTIGQMNKAFVIGGKSRPTEADVFINGCRVMFRSVNRKGYDNMINILRELRDNMPEEE